MTNFKITPIEAASSGNVTTDSCSYGAGVEIFLNGDSIGYVDGNSRKIKINSTALENAGFDSTVEYY